MMKRYLCVLLACFLALALVACGPTDEPEDDTDEGASLNKLCEGMIIDESEAYDLLALLEELGIVGEVMFCYAAEDEEDRIYYHTWIGEGSVDIYLADEGGVAAVRQAGTLLYGDLPSAPDDEEGDEPDDLPDDGAVAGPMTSITIDGYSASVVPGGSGYLCAHGLAGVEYKIKVYYAGGVSTAGALDPKTADEEGLLVWEWAVSPQVKPGVYKIVVVRADDERDSVTLPFEVVEEAQQPQ